MARSLARSFALALAVFALTLASFAQWSNPGDDVPAYHSAAPLKLAVLPPILAGAQLKGPHFRYPWQVHVYQMAIKISGVLYQLPCWCHCDRSLGHTSLRSCFESVHGTECSHCAKETVLAYRMAKAGKSAPEIRAAINRHDYESIDLEKE